MCALGSIFNKAAGKVPVLFCYVSIVYIANEENSCTLTLDEHLFVLLQNRDNALADTKYIPISPLKMCTVFIRAFNCFSVFKRALSHLYATNHRQISEAFRNQRQS